MSIRPHATRRDRSGRPVADRTLDRLQNDVGRAPLMNAAMQTLTALIDDAVTAIAAVDHAAVVIGIDQHPAVATDDTARLLDTYQRVTCDGPSLDAYRSGEVVRLFCNEPDRWKAFRAVCEWHRIQSAAAFPILGGAGAGGSDGDVVVAVLTIYSADHHAFGANEIRTARRLIGQISVADILAA